MRNFSRREFSLSTAALFAMSAIRSRAIQAATKESGLREVFAQDFLIGTALNTETFENGNAALLDLVAHEFNAITPANCMKWGPIEPQEGQWQWAVPDRFVEFGTKHNMHIVGHNLVWHSQTPAWLFVDEGGKPVSAQRLSKRMQAHIETLVGRYRGRIAIWDVVNEAIEDDDKGWRKSPWVQIIGPQFMEQAFRLAHAADPKAHLIYNDYNEHNPGKRKFLLEVIKDYQRRGVPIHGIGFQGHVGFDYPDLAEYEKSIESIAATGLRLHITELDVDVLPHAWKYTGAEISALQQYADELNPYTKGLPPQIEQQLTARYREVFEMFVRHRDKIDRVSMWGTHDGESWKNDFPVRGRTNYPLLFDRQLKPKPAYAAVAATAHSA